MVENWRELMAQEKSRSEEEHAEKQRKIAEDQDAALARATKATSNLQAEIAKLIERFNVRKYLEGIREQVWRSGEVIPDLSRIKVPEIYEKYVEYTSGLKLSGSFRMVYPEGSWGRYDGSDVWYGTGKYYLKPVTTNLSVTFVSIKGDWYADVGSKVPDPEVVPGYRGFMSPKYYDKHSNIFERMKFPGRVAELTDLDLKSTLAADSLWRTTNKLFPQDLEKIELAKFAKLPKASQPRIGIWRRVAGVADRIFYADKILYS